MIFQVNSSYLSEDPVLQRVWRIVDESKILPIIDLEALLYHNLDRCI